MLLAFLLTFGLLAGCAEPFAACIATINKMKQLDTPKLFRQLGTELTDGLAAAGKGTASS